MFLFEVFFSLAFFPTIIYYAVGLAVVVGGGAVTVGGGGVSLV